MSVAKEVNAYLREIGCMNFREIKEFSNLCRDYFGITKYGNYYGMYVFGLEFCLPMPVSFNNDFKALFLDITKLDDYLMQRYKDEYPPDMPMRVFIEKKWGSDVANRLGKLIAKELDCTKD